MDWSGMDEPAVRAWVGRRAEAGGTQTDDPD
jgi:hypothetical protein